MLRLLKIYVMFCPPAGAKYPFFLGSSWWTISNIKLRTNLTSFSQTKKLKPSIFLKVCDLKIFFLKYPLLSSKMISLWLLKNHSNLSDLSYSIIRFVESLDFNSFILACHCENLLFIDPKHGPILTGDVWIIQQTNN